MSPERAGLSRTEKMVIVFMLLSFNEQRDQERNIGFNATIQIYSQLSKKKMTL